MKRISRLHLAGFSLFTLLAGQPAAATDLELITRADPPSDTPQNAKGFSPVQMFPGFSEDERYVVFSHYGLNLVPGQVQNRILSPLLQSNVFTWDRTSGAMTLVSHAAGSPVQTGNSSSQGQSISADGRYIAFASQSTDLVAGQVDNPDTFDLFFWDRATGQIRLISHAFGSAVTAANQATARFALSADGRFVAFPSDASNLLPAGGGTPTTAVYLWDRDTGAVSLVSHRAGQPAVPAEGLYSTVRISGDGGVVAFDSSAADLVAGQVDAGGLDVFVWTRATGTAGLVSRTAGTVATTDGFESRAPSLSRDGRYVAYLSTSDALIPGGDGNGLTDAYLFDRVTGINTLVSHAIGAPAAGGDSFSSSAEVTSDGSAVLFPSNATNLVPGQVDTNDVSDLFLWRRDLDQTILVSHRPGAATTASNSGVFGGTASADGRFVGFVSFEPDLAPGQTTPPNSFSNAFLFDRASGVVSLASHRSGMPTVAAIDSSVEAIVGPTGQFLTFTSDAYDVAAGVADWNEASDLFLYERATASNRLITFHASGEASSTQSIYFDAIPSRSEVSADGRWVAFDSISPNLTGGTQRGFRGNVFLRDRAAGSTVLISGSTAVPGDFASGVSRMESISADGRFVAYVSDAPDLVAGQVDTLSASNDVFLFDRATNTSTLVSHREGQPAVSDLANHAAREARLSADGRFVAYNFLGNLDDGTDISGFYLFDRTTGGNSLITHRPGQPDVPALGFLSDDPPALSADGRYVAYTSRSEELVTGVIDGDFSPDLFLFDRVTGSNQLVTRMASQPDRALGDASEPKINADGRYVAFVAAGELVPGQDFGGRHVYLWDRTTGAFRYVSHTPGGAHGNESSLHPAISADGRYVSFSSQATDLVPNQVDGAATPDAFLFDRVADAVVLASHAPGQPNVAVGTVDSAGLPALSVDGRKLAFGTEEGLAIAGQTAPGGLFVYDRETGTNLLASHRPGDAATPGNAPATSVSFSADGSVTCFSSAARDLIARDYNFGTDIFVHSIPTAAPTGAYFTVAPCRLLDTRTAGQSPALASAAIRALTVTGRCNVPANARSIAVTLTVTGATGGGHLSLFPADLPPPATAALNFAAAQTRSSNAIASLAQNGAGTLGLSAFVAGAGTVEAIVDVLGYFE